MAGHLGKNKKIFGAQWLRLGEYGAILLIIPGIVLSVLTGQSVFAASPITLSLWLNLLRRSRGDRFVTRALLNLNQLAVHRYEVVLESSRRERADLLLDHAGKLQPRDYPQFFQVLDYRLQCIAKNRQSLETYLEEGYQIISDEIHSFKAFQAQQQQCLNHLNDQQQLDFQSSFDQAWQQLMALSDRLVQLNTVLHNPTTMVGVRTQLLDLEQAMERIESQIVVKEQELNQHIDYFWSLCSCSLDDRLNDLNQQIHTNLTSVSMAHNASNPGLGKLHQELWNLLQQFDQCGEVLKRQKDQLRDVNDRLTEIQQRLLTYQQFVLDQHATLEQAIASYRCSLPTMSGLDSLLACNDLRQQLTELQLECEPHSQTDGLASSLEAVRAEAAVKIEQIEHERRQLDSLLVEQVNRVLRPLYQRLSECDERLHRISLLLSHDVSSQQIVEMDQNLTTMVAQRDEALSSLQNRLLTYRELYVQLDSVRVKLEEIDAHVTMKVEQIPDLVESYMRQRFLPSKVSTLVSSGSD